MSYHKALAVDPRHRVRALLRFPFSPEVRAHTIAELLKDPRTAALTQEALGDQNARQCPHCFRPVSVL